MVLLLVTAVGISFFFFFSSRRRHTRWPRDWSSDVCSSDLGAPAGNPGYSRRPGGGRGRARLPHPQGRADGALMKKPGARPGFRRSTLEESCYFLPNRASLSPPMAFWTLPSALSALPSAWSFESPSTLPAPSFRLPFICFAD